MSEPSKAATLRENWFIGLKSGAAAFSDRTIYRQSMNRGKIIAKYFEPESFDAKTEGKSIINSFVLETIAGALQGNDVDCPATIKNPINDN